MSQSDKNVLAAPITTLERGMASGQDPRLIGENQAALLNNATVRGGLLHNRPGWKQIDLSFETPTVQFGFENGRFQGAAFYAPRMGIPCLVASINGRDYRFNVWTDESVQDITIGGDPNPSNLLQCWYCQAEDFLLKQDGQSPVWCYNGGSARRLQIGELPGGCMMVYALGRVWVTLPDRQSFVAGDLVGSSSGTAGYNYRDAVLKMTENTFLNEGGAFAVPVMAGSINAMAFVPNLDTSLGQGPIEVFTDNGAFSVNAPFDRTTWKDLTYPIQTVSLGSPGSLSQWSTTMVNGDIWYRGSDGIRSFIAARRDFGLWGNVPMSDEMERLLQYDADWLLPWSSAVPFDNRMMMTATPQWNAAHGVFHRALAVMDFDLISSLGTRTQPCWDGMWTGLNILQLVVGEYRKVKRCFAFVLSADKKIQLWEMIPTLNFDLPAGGARQRIKWGMETRLFDYGQPNTLKRLERGDLAPSNIQGTVYFNVQYRSDENPCWLPWNDFSICAKDSNCAPEECWTPTLYNKTYRTRITLPSPPTVCEVSPNKPSQLGFRHQARLEITGPCSIKQMVLYARDMQQAPFDGCPPTNPVCTEDTCCAQDNYFQSEP